MPPGSRFASSEDLDKSGGLIQESCEPQGATPQSEVVSALVHCRLEPLFAFLPGLH